MRRAATPVALLIVLTGIVLGLTRLVAPRVVDDPARAEALLTDALGMPVTVETVALRFRGWRPVAHLTGVTVTAPDADAPLARFAEVGVAFRPLTSALVHRFSVAEVVLHELDVALVRDADGRVSLEHSGATSDASFDAADLSPLLERRVSLRLEDARLKWRDDFRGRTPVTFEHADLRVTADDGGLVFEAAAPLPGEIGQRVSARLATDGNPLVHGWSGSAYVTVERLDVAATLDLAPGLDDVPLGGVADARVWGTIRDGHVVALAGRARFEALDGPDGPTVAPFEIATRVTPDGEHWHATAALGPVDAPQALTAHGSGRFEPSPTLEALSVRGERLDVGFFGALAAVVATALPEEATAGWPAPAKLKPRGRIESLAIDVTHTAEGLDVAYEADVASFGIEAVDDLPGLALGRIAIAGDERALRVTADPHTATVTAPARFAAPLELDLEVVDVSIRLAGAGAPVVEFPRLTAVAQDIPIALSGRLVLGGEQPHADLAARFGEGPLARLPELMPLGVMSRSGDRWLRRGLVDGRITGADIVLHGPLAAFPYAGPEGRFHARLRVEDAIVDYDPAWPRMEETDFDLVFDGARVEARVSSAQLKAATLEDTTLTLPDLNIENYVLEISGTVDTSWAGLTGFIADSPLRDGGAKDLSDLDVSGRVDMRLDLAIPLETDDDTTLLGSLKFDGNDFVSRDLGLTLEDLTGVIGFTRDDWYGQDLSARYDGEAITLIAAGGIDDPNYDVELTMSAVSPAPFLFDKLAQFAPETHAWLDGDGRLASMTGELDWRVTVTLPDGEGPEPEAPVKVEFDSNLSGLDVDLPWPLGKVAAQTRPIRVVTYADGVTDAPYEVIVSDLVHVTWTENANGITAADVRFGGVPEAPLEPGLVRLHGHLDVMPLSELATFLPQNRSGETPTGGGIPLPVTARFSVDTLDLMGQTFDRVDVAAEHRDGDWEVDFTGPDIAGTLFVTGQTARRVVFELTELRLSAPRDEETALSVDPRGIPAIDITCENFVFDERSLGRVAISTSPRDDGLTLNALTFRHEAFDIDAEGEWTVTAGDHVSRFDIAVTAPALTPMLSTFGYDTSAVSGAATDIEIHARWPGTPAEFELARLGGSLRLSLTKGALLDIEPGGGRLFGLLSLQALPRRLSLDFKDLFAEGLAFDRIEGTFELDDGDAYTNDLYLAGPSARIDISGRTGLAARDYDQRVTVTPQLTNTFPVASALFGPVGLGVGAAIYLGGQVFKGIPESVDKLFMQKYTITGSWEDPDVEQI